MNRIGSYRITPEAAQAILNIGGPGTGFHNVPDTEWMEGAVCGSSDDPEKFFPNPQSTLGEQRVRRALVDCAVCPVRAACLRYALETKSDGIWGGLREPDRERLVSQVSEGEMTLPEALEAGERLHRDAADKWQLHAVARAMRKETHGISRSA